MMTARNGRASALPLFCGLAALLLTGLRLVVRFDYTDPATGFYTTNSIFIQLFNYSYVAFLLLLAVFSRFGAARQEVRLRPRASAGAAALLMGAATLFAAVWDGWQSRTAATHGAGTLLRWGALLFSLLAACIFFVLAGELLSGGASRCAASGALALPVLHRCFLLLEAFTRHTVTAAESGYVLETLLLALGALFFVAHARVLTGRGPGQRLLLFSGYAYVATCAALYLPELLGALNGRLPLAPDAVGRMAQALSTALYVFVFTAQTAAEARRA